MNSLLHRIRAVWHSRPIVLKMLSFGVIGLGNTVIDFGVFTFAYKELPLVASNVLAWLLAVSGSYVMNTTFTFRAESDRVLRGKDYLRFVVSGVLGVVATATTLVVLSHYLPVITAKLISILAGFAVNFAMSHFIVFRPRVRLEEMQAASHIQCRPHLGRQNPNKNNTIRRSAGVFVLKTPMMSLMAWLHDV
jgi:putative flippase GtrA